MSSKKRAQPSLFLSDARGVYLPRDFAGIIDRSCIDGVEQEDWDILEAGPEHDAYWDVWTGICDGAVITDSNGVRYWLWQDGDLWLIPYGMEWSEDLDCFVWLEDDSEVIEPEDQTQGDVLGLDDERNEP